MGGYTGTGCLTREFDDSSGGDYYHTLITGIPLEGNKGRDNLRGGLDHPSGTKYKTLGDLKW